MRMKSIILAYVLLTITLFSIVAYVSLYIVDDYDVLYYDSSSNTTHIVKLTYFNNTIELKKHDMLYIVDIKYFKYNASEVYVYYDNYYNMYVIVALEDTTIKYRAFTNEYIAMLTILAIIYAITLAVFIIDESDAYEESYS